MAREKAIRLERGNPLIPGVHKCSGGYNFAVEVPEESKVSLLLYRKKQEAPVQEIVLTEKYRTGRMCAVLVFGISARDYEYNYLVDEKVYYDPCAYAFSGRERFGVPLEKDVHKIRAGFLQEKAYDWEDEEAPGIAYEDMILYKLHVRGYTKLYKGAGRKKGTFAGLVEMIPYWKELGINAIELMPAYEFLEVALPQEKEGFITERREKERLNYWGYGPGYYFAPKRSYCATREPEWEFRDFIKALHKAGIECVMEFFFPAKTDALRALRALQFWKLYYHVDGFHILGDGAPVDMIAKDGVLAGAKLMAAGFDEYSIYGGKVPSRRNLAEYNTGFLQDMRRFLKSDEGVLEGAAFHIRYNSSTHAVVNYMTCQDGFTLNDLVSYNYKHNENNGENNKDGSSYNFSWNCGVEGPCRKQAVRKIRERQIYNAFFMMLLSQGVPMIYAGDEIGNSQDGNNNAYCQDNEIGWVDWKGLNRNKRLLAFVKETIAFRKEHPILHLGSELKGSDYLAVGFPDASVHGERAWYCRYDNTGRLLGVMYCGSYAKKENGEPDDLIYIGYNFHWEERKAALPNLPEKMKWKKVADTSESSDGAFFREREEEYEKAIEVGARSIVVLLGKQEG